MAGNPKPKILNRRKTDHHQLPPSTSLDDSLKLRLCGSWAVNLGSRAKSHHIVAYKLGTPTRRGSLNWEKKRTEIREKKRTKEGEPPPPQFENCPRREQGKEETRDPRLVLPSTWAGCIICTIQPTACLSHLEYMQVTRLGSR